MDLYSWLKSLHVIAIICWMAGLLYLPRLFVYHCETEVGSDQSEQFKVMERRLLRAIMNPAMIVSWVLGLWMVYESPFWLEQGWFHVKLTCLIGLTACHMGMAKWRRKFAEDANEHGHKFYRVMNEVPTVLMIIIVIMVVGKPF